MVPDKLKNGAQCVLAALIFYRQCLFCRQNGSSKRLGRNEAIV